MHRMLAIGDAGPVSAARTTLGFTLVELLVVLTILVMCSALIPWSISRMLPGRRVAATAERIKIAVLETQAQSAVTGRPLQVVVADHVLVIDAVGTEIKASAPMRTVKLPGTTEIFIQSAGGQQQKSMIVYPDGATTGGRFEVADGRRQLSVSVSALTGRVAVQDGL